MIGARAWAISVVGLGLLCSVACGDDASSSDESVRATSYDQTCVEDDDCVLVTELTKTGTRCSMGCPRGPINKSDQEKFTSDVSRARGDCTEMAQPSCIPAESGPTCVAGTCTAPAAGPKG